MEELGGMEKFPDGLAQRIERDGLAQDDIDGRG